MGKHSGSYGTSVSKNRGVMWSKAKQLIKSDSACTLYGQASFLLSGFIIFLALSRQQEMEMMGTWAIYITYISIADSMRQGIIQNALIRFVIQSPEESPAYTVAAFIINTICILAFSLFFALTAQPLSTAMGDPNLAALLSQAYIGLMALGTLQFISVLLTAKRDFNAFFWNNFLYLLSFAIGFALLGQASSLQLTTLIELQLLAVMPGCLWYMVWHRPPLALPKRAQFNSLMHFGKYTAGTNLLSMLFHKADILMLAFFTDPATVALFHFATKIVGYADLPLNALSQVIYPQLAASYRSQEVSHLKDQYLKALMRLFTLSIPISLGVIMFNKLIITVLSSDAYSESSLLIVILCLGTMAKPLGRVFGLSLEAMGLPKVNFQMLLFSLMVNISLNALLIPYYGATGAAIATASSITLTVFLGQIRLRKWFRIGTQDIYQVLLQHLPFHKLKTKLT